MKSYFGRQQMGELLYETKFNNQFCCYDNVAQYIVRERMEL